MADLLRSGNKMLNLACPVCNNPIFRNSEGKMFCPTCDREVIFAETNSNQNRPIEKSKINNDEDQGKLYMNRNNEILKHLENIIYQKIEIITVKLENESNSQVIKTYTKILLDLIDVLKKISAIIDNK